MWTMAGQEGVERSWGMIHLLDGPLDGMRSHANDDLGQHVDEPIGMRQLREGAHS